MIAIQVISISVIIDVINFQAAIFSKHMKAAETEKMMEYFQAIMAITNLTKYLRERIADFSPDDIITVDLESHRDTIIMTAESLSDDLEDIRVKIPADRLDMIEELEKMKSNCAHVLEILKN